MKKIKIFVSIFLIIIILISCKDTEPLPDSVQDNEIVNNVAENVIFATYKGLDDKAGILATAIQTLKATPNESNLEQCKVAWRNARLPWEQSEGFLFGPVDNAGIDPSIDSWPVNIIDLENVLKSMKEVWRREMDSDEELILDAVLYEFEWVLPGHGRRYNADRATMAIELRRCIEWMKESRSSGDWD